MGAYLLEGVKPLMDALEMNIPLERIFIREGCGIGMIPEERALGLDADLFDSMSDTETSQGVIAVVRQPDMGPGDFVKKAAKGNILVMDRLQDPGNVGTIIRTAEAAGYAGIIALKGTADVYSPKVVRSAAGSLFRMPVLTGLPEEDGVSMIREGGWKLVVTSVEGGESCFEVNEKATSALVIGNEGSGVSESLIKEADLRLMIPMEGRIESLNAAVAAGILMYQLKRG